MKLELTEAERSFAEELREFYSRNVDPDWRRQCQTVAAEVEYLRRWDKVLYEGGWAAPAWPVEYGGRAANAVQRAIFAEETAKFDAPEGLNRLGKRLVAPVLMRYGTPDQKHHIGAILRGEEIWCQGFSEPDAGSDLAGLRTRATRDGRDWVVNGRKIWTSFAQAADYIFLLVRTGSLESRQRGISVLFVDMQSPGVEVWPIETLAGRSEFNEVTFEGTQVPSGNLVGSVDAGWGIVRDVLQNERGAEFCLARYSDIRRIFESLVAHARTGVLDSTDLNSVVGELYARIFTVQLLGIDLLFREQGSAVPAGFPSLVKLFTTETWRRLGDDQILHCGMGLFDFAGEQQLDDLYESRHYTISAGTSEIQRNLIASGLLGLPSTRVR